jgi:hypothetical protein
MILLDSRFSEFATAIANVQRDKEALFRCHCAPYSELHGCDFWSGVGGNHETMLARAVDRFLSVKVMCRDATES